MTQRDPSSNHEGQTLVDARIDEALRRVFRPPGPERLASIAQRALAEDAATPAATPRRFRPALALAAGLAAAITGAWLTWGALAPRHAARGPYETTWRSFETAYRDWTAGDFKPQWSCRDDKEFADSFRGTLHQALLLKGLPPDTEALGLVVCNSLSPRTTCLLARSAGQPVVVFVDRIERDAPMEAPSGLNLFRRQIDRLVLYEVTPLAAPCLLTVFYNPQSETAP
jgi:hypothetical protein